jgi:hypothetical protein
MDSLTLDRFLTDILDIGQGAANFQLSKQELKNIRDCAAKLIKVVDEVLNRDTSNVYPLVPRGVVGE